LSTTNENIRKYFPGDEWLYYKFYIGRHYSNNFLQDCVYQAGELLIKDNIIDKWFFIRYHDPDDHIRFRVHLIDKNNIHIPISLISKLSNSFTRNNKLVWKIQIDTYNQEIERYSHNEISSSEKLFYLSSILTCKLIELGNTETDWILWSIYFIKHLFVKIGMTEDHLNTFLTQMDKSYKNEFSINKKSKHNIKIKYLELTDSIRSFDSIQTPNELEQIIERYCHEFVDTLGYKKEFPITSEMKRFISSHIHMFVNRLFFEKQREYEMLIYDILLREYTSSN